MKTPTHFAHAAVETAALRDFSLGYDRSGIRIRSSDDVRGTIALTLVSGISRITS